MYNNFDKVLKTFKQAGGEARKAGTGERKVSKTAKAVDMKTGQVIPSKNVRRPDYKHTSYQKAKRIK